MNRTFPVLTVVGLVAVLAGCSGQNASQADAQTSDTILRKFQQAQPVPQYDWSQIRQTLIEVETAQAQATQTTSFMFNQGAVDPYMVCPSIGFPVAATSQLTSPDKSDWASSGSAVTAQIDPNGIYSGNSTGTYVLCTTPSGKVEAQYAEGFVHTAVGPAEWDLAHHSIKLTGDPTFKFTQGRTK